MAVVAPLLAQVSPCLLYAVNHVCAVVALLQVSVPSCRRCFVLCLQVGLQIVLQPTVHNVIARALWYAL